MEIFDTHAHYDDSSFDSDREILLSETLPKSGVCGVISAGVDIKTSKANLELSRKYEYIYFAAGIQPEEVEKIDENYIDLLSDIIKSSNKAVAVGEIGLDYHWNTDRTIQKRVFEEQLRLAKELGKPVVIHDREAHYDTLEILKKYTPAGTLHCFSGSVEIAMEFVKLGLYIGFTGAVTFKNNKKAPKVIEAVPLDRILVETDCPYMAPVPFRGHRSDSSMLVHTIEFIAGIKGLTPEEMAHITAQNARRLFRIE